MTTTTAALVVGTVAAVGALVWLVSLLQALRALGPETGEIGPVTVDGEREDVSRRIAEALVSGPALGVVPIRVDSADADAVRFRVPAGSSLVPLTARLEGEYVLRRAADGRVRVTIRTNRAAARRGARVALGICLLAGLPLLVVLPAVLMAFVVGSPLPAVRAQAFQVLQVVHVLWPPFLVVWLGRRNQTIVEEGLGQVLDRLRFGRSL
jgi:hypothetical protein